jgi:methyl-accepting chemotaxis protein
MLLIYILIVLFVVLISYQVYLAMLSRTFIVEGLENNDTTYKPYTIDQSNSLILSQQNAGNIEVLKGRINSLDGVKQSIADINQSINSMQTQIDGLVEQQANYAQEIAGSTPVDITGTSYETTENVEDSIEEEDK